jgi:hypothetical protein
MNQDPHILANPPKRQPIFGKKTYAVNIQTTITGTEKPVNSTVAYTLEIEYSSHDFTFKKANVIVDGNPIPTKINDLYLKTAQPLNNIQFRCTEQGNIKELYKHEQLLKTWEQTKRQVAQQFTGEPVTHVIAQLDKTYNNKHILIQRLNTNIVLQTFYRTFISDYLIYYGQTNTAYTNTGILSNIPLHFAGIKTLGLKDEQLYVQSDASLNKDKANTEQLEAYFKNKIEDFKITDLEISNQDRTLLDYDSVWINQSTVSQTVQAKNYKKEVILSLQST